MKIRYFLGVGIIYIALVTIYAFYITHEGYELHNTLWTDFSVYMPIALWIALPMVLLWLIALIFMSFGAMCRKFKEMSLNRDIDKIITQIQEQMLGNTPQYRGYGISGCKNISSILRRFYLLPNMTSSVCENERIDSNFEALRNIESGSESSKIKLNPAHPLYIRNIENSFKNDPQKALNVLKQDVGGEIIGGDLYKNAPQILYTLAWSKIIESKNIKLIEKALNLPTPRLNLDVINKIIESITQESINIKQDMLIKMCKDSNLGEREYLKVAIKVAKILNQNNINFWLSFFDMLSKQVESVVFAYFYLLLEVGKIKEARELKSHYPKGDFLPVSAYLELKDKGYPLLVFFDPLYFREYKSESRIFNTPSQSVQGEIS